MDNADAFIRYAASGKLTKLQELVSQSSPEQLHEYITRNYYEAYHKACKNGSIDVMTYLETLSLKKKERMIRSLCYTAYRNAASAGNLDAIKHIEKQLPNDTYKMRTCISCDALTKAFENHHEATIHYLLEEPNCLAYADEHNILCNVKYINSFADKKIKELRQLQQAFSDANPDEIFDLAKDESSQYFYLLRHIIRRSNPELEDYMRFLLKIPSILSMTYKGHTSNKPMELIQLAIQVNNDRAVSLLMSIEEVRVIAENNRVFQNIVNIGFDLKAYFEHQKFILNYLTDDQQNQLAKVCTNYQNRMKDIAINNSMLTITNTLNDSYMANPATIRVGGIIYKLPVSWDQFIQCKFDSNNNYDAALNAYKEHTLHTALRYLCIPNRWISIRAKGTNSTLNNPKLRWSTFHELQPLIILFWFICQKNYPRINVEYFSDALSKLGRVYNRSADGERDDWEGDKPADTLVAKLALFIIIATIEEERCKIQYTPKRPFNLTQNRAAFQLFQLNKQPLLSNNTNQNMSATL